MKKIVLISIVFLSFYSYSQTKPSLIKEKFKPQSYSYMRWIEWVADSTHVATVDEMADIVSFLKETDSLSFYKLSSGIKYKINNPKIYSKYILKVIKETDSSIKTIKDAAILIKHSEAIKWGNDISLKVKNYYYSSLHNKVQYIDNYTGNSGVDVLLINGIPRIKLDCGNPLGLLKKDKIVLSKKEVDTLEVEKVDIITTKKVPHVADNIFLLKRDKRPIYNKKLFLLPKQLKPKRKSNSFKVLGITIGVGTIAYFLLRRKGGQVDSGGPAGVPGND